METTPEINMFGVVELEARQNPLPMDFFDRPAEAVARDLLGRTLIHTAPEGTTAGIMVETEAYLGREDPACHSARGRTTRNAPMFGPAGGVYVYLIYGMHFCFNIVTGGTQGASAVLVRALEPVEGLPLMEERRGQKDPRLLCSGPARLAQAMGIDLAHNGTDVMRGPIKVVENGGISLKEEEIVAASRIGISKAVDWPLRFYYRNNPCVSKK